MKNRPVVSVVIPTHDRRQKVGRLIQSVLDSDYPMGKMEVIVVDGKSSDGTGDFIEASFPQVKLIRMEKDLHVSGSRNMGIDSSSGRYIFLIDDDNVIDRGCIGALVQTMENDPRLGEAMPLMYSYSERDRIWCSGVSRDMITSITSLNGGKAGGSRLIDTRDCPNAFMIRREAIMKTGAFDQENFPFHYEEADLGERMRRAGYSIVCDTKARLWHDSDLMGIGNSRLVQSDSRAFHSARNRMVFHRKYSAWWQFVPFILVFYPLISAYYIGVIFFKSGGNPGQKAGKAWAYARGALSGIRYIVTGK
jgi:GT2 family glycosyltransferase